jgi:ribosomal protein L14
MKPNFIKLLLVSFICFFVSPVILHNEAAAQTTTGSLSAVATFHSIGLYWSGSGGSSSTVCNVQYRVAGSGAAYKNGYPLYFDSRGVGGRPTNEYRGSLVNLTPGTAYEIIVTAGSATNTITISTWSETFPVGTTTTVANSSSQLNITTSGTASGYRLYTPATGQTATIDVANNSTNCIYINAAYIIIRGLILKGAGEDAILLGPNAHDVVIENNEITGWGYIGMGSNNQAGVRVKGFSYNALGVERIIIQRNKIHDSRDNSNSWDDGGHPLGPNGINFEHAGGNHVIRYNEVYNTVAGKKFMDGIGGADNFTFDGFPNLNSDIYGNKVSQCYDDALEIEGADCNVRVWGNFTDDTFTGISCATNSVGPLYIFNNVTNMSVRSKYGSSNATIDGEDRGPFNKCGSQDATVRGGRTFLFHNTTLQPIQSGFTYPRGMGGGPVDNGGPVANVYSRNNIWQTYKSDHPAIGEWQSLANNGNTYDYDLYNFSLVLVSNSEAGTHMLHGSPTYAIGTPTIGDPNPAGYFLASGSMGLDGGVVLNNFNDGYTGAAPDVGAYETGKPALQFGVNAYLNNNSVTANAGTNITLTLPTNSTTLNGSGTTSTGTITSYAWTRVSGPTTFTLANAAAASTALTGLVQGTYVFRLTVTNSSGASATADVTVTVNAAANQPPTANAGSDITLTLPTNSTTLVGSGTDPDGTIASYAWARVSGPTTFTLVSPNTATTGLTGLVQGTYLFRLTVTDNSGASASDTVKVTVNPAPNQSPTANAGADITITLPTNSTSLTGSGSDPDGTIASYAWARVSGPTTFTLVTPNAATTALTGLVQGTYLFRLTVTDNGGATASDTVKVTVNAAPNQPPTANAGADITITLPTNSTTLTGSGTDPDGTIASYAWARVSGPTTFTLATPNAATTALTGLVQGTYLFRLTVTDNLGATASDTVRVTVNAAPNQPPVANAGNNITLTLPTNSTTLTGTGTDPDGTIAGYAWSRVSGPTTFTLGTPNAATTSLTGLVQGTYVFRLTVTDNSGATATDDVTVTVNPAPNQPPTADAGNNIIITLPTNSTTLTGTGTDPDGTIVSYAWTKISGPASFTIVSPNTATTSITGLVQGVYVFRLTVTDNSGATATDDVTITVNASAPANQAPVANAGLNRTINLPTNSTTLDGSASFDPDGTITGYSWTKVSGPATFTLANASAATTTLSNLVAGTYVFELTVTDNNGAIDQDNVTIVVSAVANQAPIANAGANITMTLPLNSTNLNGGGSSDPDGIIVSYAWTKVSGPATYTINNPNEAATGLSNLVAGVYVFRLTVTDNAGATATDDVTVTVNAAPNQVPTANAGSDVTLTLPVNSTILTGSGYDPDGTITSYTWTKVSGPASYTLVNANAAVTNLKDLVQGVYVFRITVTDNNGATATDNVTITVNAAIVQPNQAPTANAGSDITITLPVNSTILTGSGYDPDGTIVGYSWTKVSGPANYTLVSANTAVTNLKDLVQGTYVFRLTVTDNNGATAVDNVTVNVVAAANQAPTANAGADIIITLPTNTTTLYGSGNDPDGTIASYTWSKVSGPATFTIANISSATTGLYNLVQGVYIFRLTVTDNGGATATDNVTVTVNAAPAAGNQPPIARTENDILLTLPTNYTQLHGNTSSDPDGVITAYQWTQLSGPSQALISDGQTSISTVSDLTTGIYTFELKVTDNAGASSTKTIKVTVENPKVDKPILKVYPNPTSSTVNLQYVATSNGRYRVMVYNASRQLLVDDMMDKTQVSVTKVIDLSRYESGVYFIQIISSDNQQRVTAEVSKMPQ